MSIGAIQDSGAAGTTVAARAPATAAKSRPAQEAIQAAKSGGQDQPADLSRGKESLSLEQAVDRLKQFVSPTDADINFAIDGTSGVPVVKIVDRSTKDVIRQIPSEEAISLAMALDKLQGLFVREKV